jgi:hypothetical protein
MRKIHLAFIAMLFLVFNIKAYASATLRKQMIEYESKAKPTELDLDKLQINLSLIFSRYGNDFSQMDVETLKSYIADEKVYYLGKEGLANELNKIYISNYTPQTTPIDKELKSVLANLAKNCNVLSKITSKCLNERESLVFQAEYLKQKIEALDIAHSGLVYQINSQIVEDDMASRLKASRLN